MDFSYMFPVPKYPTALRTQTWTLINRSCCSCGTSRLWPQQRLQHCAPEASSASKLRNGFPNSFVSALTSRSVLKWSSSTQSQEESLFWYVTDCHAMFQKRVLFKNEPVAKWSKIKSMKVHGFGFGRHLKMFHHFSKQV